MNTLERAHALLIAQNDKGKGKYGGTLDDTRPGALALVRHAREEAADKLMYLTALETDVAALVAENAAMRATITMMAGTAAPIGGDTTARDAAKIAARSFAHTKICTEADLAEWLEGLFHGVEAAATAKRGE